MGAVMAPADLIEKAVLFPIGLAAALVTIQVILCFPLTLAYVLWKRASLRRIAAQPFTALVSVLVPAYNEEKMLRSCVESLLTSCYEHLEIIVVDDGSVDGTADAIDGLVDGVKVRYIRQLNGGKATALNRGAAASSGEVILFTDADSIFLPDTVSSMVRWFAEPTIDAVCGSDVPLNTRTPLQRVLAVTSHIGTSFVRRALSVLGVLPIISGNLGAVRTSVFREIGGFRQTWGEDLEFTFKLQALGKRIIFDASPVVRAECPADLRSLWRQRTRWVRSYLKVAAMHSRLFVPNRAFPFSLYLPFNYFALTVIPILQIAAFPFLIRLAFGNTGTMGWILNVLLYLGLLTFTVVAAYSIVLDHDFRTLKHLPIAVVLIVPLSFFYSIVVLSSVWQEWMGRAEKWEKIERLPSAKSGRVESAILVGALLLLFAGAASQLPGVTHWLVPHFSVPIEAPMDVSNRPPGNNHEIRDIAIATHFDDWHDWHDAITSVLASPVRRRLRTFGISAGRVEWAHFQWKAHQANWSSPQKHSSGDILATAIHEFRSHGLRTVAIVDFYSPALVMRDRQLAAVRFDGKQSSDQICFTELVDGEYGRQIVEMVSYLSHNYPLDAIALTELDYHSFCFDDRCLRSYREMSGRQDWPRQMLGTSIDRDDPTIWRWRSAKMQQFLRRVADAAHSGGKRLIVDVPVNWKDLQRRGKDSGLEYARVLQCADQIVVWNYFGVEGRSPEVSAKIAGDLVHSFAPERFFVSVGLWEGQRGSLDPQSFGRGLEYTMKSGAENIWITPNKLMTSDHWSALRAALETVDGRNGSTN
jgi:cellulose synthase/poly-beta-1,6-N-acetylglucosamine synthase-like glycosyltransferase